jgi:hypothetical protein
MKSLDQLNSRKHLFTIATTLGALIASLIIVSPFFLSRTENTSGGAVLRVPQTHDMVQHLAVMKDFDKVLKSGNLYPRWLPDYNKGYGGPWMDFYPPGFYYLASLFNLVTNDWINAVFIISVLGLAASGLAFYLLSRLFYSRAASATAALLYMALSCHVVDLYWRGALPQFMGFIFLPLVVYFAFKVGSGGRAYDYAGLALFYGLFLMMHSPVSLLMTYALAFYALAWAARDREWKIALRIGIGMAIGIALGAIYWFPAAYDRRFIQEFFTLVFPYHSSYLTLMPGDDFTNLINHSFALQTLLLIIAILILRAASKTVTADERDGRQEIRQTRLWIIMAVATTFMCTSYSIYISRLLPKIDIATFAWRWLPIACLFTLLVVAATIDKVLATADFSPARLWGYRAALGAAIVFNIWFTWDAVIFQTLSHPTMNATSDYVDGGFTPTGASYPQTLPDTPLVMMNPEKGSSEVVFWQPYHRQVIVSAEEPSTVRIKTYNYPGWVARLDGEAVPLSSDEHGVQLISIPPGRHTLETRFASTPARTFAAVLTVLGFLTVFGLTVIGFVQRSKQRVNLTPAPARQSYTAVAGGSVSDKPGPQLMAKEKTEKRAQIKPFWPVAIILLVLLVGLIVVVSVRRAGNPSSVDGAQTGLPGAPRAASMAVGSEVRLRVAGAVNIFVAVDPSALDEMVRALSSKDNAKVESMVQSGRVITIDNNTRVRILEVNSGRIKARILDGPNTLMDGWVPERWVQ